MRPRRILGACATAAVCLLLAACATHPVPAPMEAPTAGAPTAGAPPARTYIVQAADAETAAALVRRAGGEVGHELTIIRAVGATLTASERQALEDDPRVVRVWEDRAVAVEQE